MILDLSAHWWPKLPLPLILQVYSWAVELVHWVIRENIHIHYSLVGQRHQAMNQSLAWGLVIHFVWDSDSTHKAYCSEVPLKINTWFSSGLRYTQLFDWLNKFSFNMSHQIGSNDLQYQLEQNKKDCIFLQTCWNRGCSTNIFVTDWLLESVYPFPPHLQNIINLKLLQLGTCLRQCWPPLYVLCCMSHVTCHLSRVTCHKN